MKVKSVEEVLNFLKPFAEENGVELVDVEIKVGKNPSLTIYVETEDGVDLKTLEKFHNAINDPLDDLDPTYGAPYTLNVSSPGLDRPFKTERDFERNLGLDVEIKLFAPIKGKKFFEGQLIEFDHNTVTVMINGTIERFEKTKIAKISRAIVFD